VIVSAAQEMQVDPQLTAHLAIPKPQFTQQFCGTNESDFLILSTKEKQLAHWSYDDPK